MQSGDRRKFEYQTTQSRHSNGGILRSDRLRGNGLGRLCIGVCTFLSRDHLSVSKGSVGRMWEIWTYPQRNFLRLLEPFEVSLGRTADQPAAKFGKEGAYDIRIMNT